MDEEHQSIPSLSLSSSSIIEKERDKENNNWSKINKELIKNGYPPISNHDTLSSLITTLLTDIQRKDTLIAHLTHEKTTPTNTPQHSATNISLMKKQLSDLQYTNAKLRVDVMNRPHTAELKACQQRVNELEAEIRKYKKSIGVSSNGTECVKDIATMLNVDQLTDVVPHVLSLQYESEQLNEVKPYLQSLSSLFCTSGSHSDVLCPSLWSHVLDTLKEWNKQLKELKELQLIFTELYSAIEQRQDTTKGKKKKRRERDSNSIAVVTCHQMKDIIKYWLTHYNEHQEAAEVGLVMSMVRHFQELFDVQSLGGVYVAMTTVYRQIHESHMAYRQLTELLGQSGCSWQRLVSLLEIQLEYKEKKLYENICEQFGTLSYTDIIDTMSLSQKFFPHFHSLITELQSILGVESLSAIIPAVRRLTYT